VSGDDLLDVRKEALTLAMVLAHRDVDPPISVGLFGDWGSGKSFFMAEMRALINQLSEQSRDNKGRFCERIVQLEFNAWHYMDSDLWASLAREIFEGLTTVLAERENPDLDLERERLRVATRSTKDLIAATARQKTDVQNQLDQTARRLADVEHAQASVQTVARAAVTAVLETPEVERKLRSVAADLKLDEAGRSIDELKAHFDELSGAARFARALSAGLAKEWKGLLAGLLVVAIVSSVGFVIASWFKEQIAAFVAQVTIILGGLATLLATIVPGTKTVLDRVAAFSRSVDENVQRQQRDRANEFEARRQELEAEQNRLRGQQAQYEHELVRLDKLSNELGRLDASHQLVDFIRQRDASTDYRAQLGTIARASQDFKRLSDLMQRAAAARRRKAENQATETDEEDAKLPHIDRIVLYIDDLDRCPEKKVVDVLQAVHLLLAYPLFVVVVGVDPRWLMHSLEEHSGAFRTSIGEGYEDRPDASYSASPDIRESREEDSDDWHSTSLNYLEKIFQIPYTLRPMSADGYLRLVNDLTTSKSGGESPTLDEKDFGSPAAEEGAFLLDANPPALELVDRERVFMARMYELIPTPRATKRFVNVYRLIRASITTSHELRWFLEEREFAAVQVLLAIMTGAPAEASEILRALLARPKHGAWEYEWWGLVDEVLEPRLDRPEWRRLGARLKALRAEDDVPRTCQAFRKWADDVARYSFYSGRILLGRQGNGSEARA
jgi:hypothetical protein